MSERSRSATLGRWAVVAVALVVLVVPGRLLASRHAEDDALVPYGAGPGSRARAAAGETWRGDAGVVTAHTARIQVVEVRPRVSKDTTGADITVQVCRRGAHGSVTVAPADSECRVVSDLPARRVHLRPGADRLVVSVRPRHAGTVLIEGYDVTYVAGGRRGTEHAGVRLRLRVA